MSRYSIDPVFYTKIRGEQDQLRREYMSTATEVKTCPYCQHKSIVIGQGSKGIVFTKCRKCNEEVLFRFRRKLTPA